MIIDHVSLVISDYPASKDFYLKSLAPLGIKLIVEAEGWAGFGRDGKAAFWFGPEPEGPGTGSVHIAFDAADRASVDAFYEAAIGAGGKDNGPPGVREIYHPDYYGAFVLDPDGHNIEAVCHLPAGDR